jgi:hypothetical protein
MEQLVKEEKEKLQLEQNNRKSEQIDERTPK